MNTNNIFSGNTILVIDNDVVNFLILSAFLEGTAMTVLHAESSTEAIEFVDLDTPFDLIIVDVNPDSLKALKYIQHKLPDIPVVIHNYQSKQEMNSIIEHIHFDAILNKPPKKQDFINTLNSFIEPKEEESIKKVHYSYKIA